MVPDFKTMTISECYIFANDNGITLAVTEQHDDYVPKGSVISQSVKAEETINRGSEIELIVSKGKLITVPSFKGYSKDEAVSFAGSLGIPVTAAEKYSGSRAGAFLSQSIEAGTIYEEGDHLELYYSLGNRIALASFVGQTQDEIQNWANELNKQGARITIKVETTQSSSPKGVIIYQDIANTLIKVKTTINVTVSSGKIIYVPDFVDNSSAAGRGYDTAVTREEAIAMCEEAGLVPVFVSESSAGRLDGEVWHQSIAAGTEISEGSTITLKFTPSKTYEVIDFTDKTKAEVINAGYGAKFTIKFEEYEEYVAGKAGLVCDQSEPESKTLAAGAEIILYLGPQPTASPT